ncbi:hypothetical protein Nepgr_030872 [Nepenthes gracilis]|uniref:Uncharacterized protein n=1 Tax=Nepenthes gracilis TaxID=150966 RepID=A0AAD3TH74_NEPGR|nr:hypothetical protein Nepgr_030872 [Nepenthes gracilis]
MVNVHSLMGSQHPPLTPWLTGFPDAGFPMSRLEFGKEAMALLTLYEEAGSESDRIRSTLNAADLDT